MNLIVCGSRTWWDASVIADVLDGVLTVNPGPIRLLHGAAEGADSLAEQAIRSVRGSVTVEPFPITKDDWAKYQHGAGPRRNGLMLKRLLELPMPRLVIAFRLGNTSNGTDDMIVRARKANVDTLVYYRAEAGE